MRSTALAALAAVLLNSAARSWNTPMLAAGGEARISLDAKDAPIADIVRVQGRVSYDTRTNTLIVSY